MKRITMLAALFVLTTAIFAQKVTGTFTPLKNETRAQVVLDYSNATIHGMSESEFADYERDWEVDQPEIYANLLSGLQDKLGHKLIVGKYPNAKYTLKIEFVSISAKGNCICDAVLLNGTEEVGRIANIYAKGGKVGSKLNLIKDGAEHSGSAIGSQLRKLMK